MAISAVSSRNLFAQVPGSSNANGQDVSGDTFSAALAKAVGNAASTTKSDKDPVKEFLEYANMSPGEKMLYAWLKQKGLSKEEFDALPPEKKQKLIDEMKREIETKVKQKAEAEMMRNSIQRTEQVKRPERTERDEGPRPLGEEKLTDILA